LQRKEREKRVLALVERFICCLNRSDLKHVEQGGRLREGFARAVRLVRRS
jgi:hypothetical protein